MKKYLQLAKFIMKVMTTTEEEEVTRVVNETLITNDGPEFRFQEYDALPLFFNENILADVQFKVLKYTFFPR